MTDPTHLEGKARVKYFQQRYNYICRQRKIPHTHVTVDGVKGPHTKHAIVKLKRCFGVRKQNADTSLDNPFMRHLESPFHKQLFKAPGQWARGAAYRTYLRRQAGRKPLRLRALHVANTLVGVMEHGGNNAGATVSRIIRENGGGGPEPWCGDFVAFCYRHAGSHSVSRSWALARLTGGAHHTSNPLPGDAVYYRFDHVGMFVRDLGNGYIETIEGNTGASGAVSDSSTGGDGVYRKHRAKSLVSHYTRVSR